MKMPIDWCKMNDTERTESMESERGKYMNVLEWWDFLFIDGELRR